MSYYLGDVSDDLPQPEGRSGVVSMDVADTIEGLMPSLMEIFASADDVVEFAPVGAEDEELALQETDYVNHIFMEKNPGFLVLYGFIKDALLSKNGFVKVWWETGKVEERETYIDLSEEAFTALAGDPEVEVIEHSSKPDPYAVQMLVHSLPMGEEPPPEALQQLPMIHDVTVVATKEYGCARVMGVPPEEFGIERSARTLAECNYCFHQPPNRTEAELIADGYPVELVRTLPSDSNRNNDSESAARDTVDEGDVGTIDNINRAARKIKITEHYVRMDYEGDGEAKLYRVTTAGDEQTFMQREGEPVAQPIDMIPFASMTPIIQPHRFFGRSIADIVMDIMRIKTALLRALLDNAYLANNPRTEIAESHAGKNTLDDLLTARPNGIVRTKAPGGLQVIQTPPIGTHVFPLVEYFDGVREWRTGVTRQGQGIDANALQNQSATAVSQMFTAAQARMKLIARIFAETGIRDLFALLHATIRKNDREVNTVKLRNKWVQISPREWKTREDVTVSVGLGGGGKQMQIMMMNLLMQIQEKIVVSGAGGNLVTMQNVYNALKKFTLLIGEKSADPYFNDPSQSPPAPPKPDPKMMELQGKMQIEQFKAQNESVALHGKMEIERMQAQADIASEERKVAAQIALEERKAQLERELKMLDHQLEREKHEQELAFRAREHEFNMQVEHNRFTLDSQRAERDDHRAERQFEREGQAKERDFAFQRETRDGDAAREERNATRKMQADAQAKAAAPPAAPDPQIIKALGLLSDGQNKTLQALTRPRKLIRGQDGKIAGIE